MSAVDPRDPMLIDLKKMIASQSVGRRGLLRGIGAAAAVGGSAALLSACGIKGKTIADGSCKSVDNSATVKTLNWSNWPAYLDQNDAGTSYPSLNAFTKQTGITVKYSDEINDNDAFIAKIRNQLGACEPTGRDIITITDTQASFMIKNGWVQELDPAKIPNVISNLRPEFKNQTWDPNSKYHAPWQGGFTGIAWNSKLTTEVATFKDLITRPDLKGKVGLLTEMGDTMGFFLLQVGADPNNFTSDDYDKALALVESTVASGQIRRFTGNDYIQDMESGNLVACLAWSGDVLSTIQAADGHPEVKFSYPEEGYGFWFDNMMVPNQSNQLSNAEAVINYYYEPEVAATVADWIGYMTPVNGAQQAMEKIDPDAAKSEAIFPTSDALAKSFFFKDLDEATYTDYKTKFDKAASAA